MKMPERVREVMSSPMADTTNFSISKENQAHIKKILRNNIYSDKVMAVLREYSANAWDAHRMMGKRDVPIEVTLPTATDPQLIIKDYGPGLSHEDVFTVFTQYGTSTKRSTNDAIGMLGIGSKSGFAYTDTFTVISRHGGKKRVYVAHLDEQDNDALSLMGETDCGDDTGLTIQIGVHQADITSFHDRAKSLFQHFEPRPKINTALPEPPALSSKLKNGVIYAEQIYYSNNWHAVMGGIPYSVDLHQLTDDMERRSLSSTFFRCHGLVYFDIGDVDISASRETLDYTTRTKKALVQKFEDLLDEYIQHLLKELESDDSSNWEKRLYANSLKHLNLSQDLGEWSKDYVKLCHREDVPNPTTFRMPFNRNMLGVYKTTRIIRVKDIPKNRKLKNYDHRANDFLIAPNRINENSNELYSWDQINTELDQFLKDRKIDGITVIDITDLDYIAPVRAPGYDNPKHKAEVFKYVGHESYYKHNNSDYWEITDHEPTKDDVMVVLHRFQVDDVNRFDEQVKNDRKVMEILKITPPTIYGIKSTSKNPISTKDLIGIPYAKWRKNWFKSLDLSKYWKELNTAAWQKHDRVHFFYSGISLSHVEQNLGKNHALVRYLRNVLLSSKKPVLDKQMTELHNALSSMGFFNNKRQLSADKHRERLAKKYPLLDERGYGSLESTRSVLWFEYIKAMDLYRVSQNATQAQQSTQDPHKSEEKDGTT